MRLTLKLFIIAALVLFNLALIYYANFVLKTDIVYSHFFYLPVILAGFWWGKRGIGVALFLGIALAVSSYMFRPAFISCVPDFLRAGMVIIVGLTVALLRDTNLNAEKRIRYFSRKILAVREEEKKRTALDLHDELGAMAVAVNSNLDILEDEIKKLDVNAALGRLEGARSSLKKSVGNLKQLAAKLRPPDLDLLPIDEALRQYCASLNLNGKPKIELNVDLPEKKLYDEAMIVLYRLIQEALTNIIKHANAGIAKVNISSGGRDVKVEISDDGEGFDAGQVLQDYSGKTGIEGMRQRVESLGGKFEIKSEKKMGCRVYAVIPWALKNG